MLIAAACQECGITKKAIEHYESKGLISPTIMENGYRDYSSTDIRTLKEISVLRKCGISVTDIGIIINSSNKAAALAKHKYLTEIRSQQAKMIQQSIDRLIENYDVESEFSYMQAHGEDVFTIKERLVLAFPGDYGMFLSLHFARFLDCMIDTDKKRAAYADLISYLDQVGLHMSPELSAYLNEMFTLHNAPSAAQAETLLDKTMEQMRQNPVEYIKEHRQEFEEYLEYRQSDLYRSSPAAKFYGLMQEFQQHSGYREKLVQNMEILSPDYRQYRTELEAANQLFLQEFPQAKEIIEMQTP